MVDKERKALDEAYQKVVMAINNTSYSDAYPDLKEKLLSETKAYYDMRINQLSVLKPFEDSVG